MPQSPSAAEAELAMWQLASRMGSLNVQQPPQPPPPQPSAHHSPFAGADRDPWGHCADEQQQQQQQQSHLAATSLFSNGGGGGGGDGGNGSYGLHHCESAPAGLFQEELRHLRKLGLAETLGMVSAHAHRAKLCAGEVTTMMHAACRTEWKMQGSASLVHVLNIRGQDLKKI